MSWLFFALTTALLWGVGQVIIKKGLTNITPLGNILIGAIINILVYIPFSLTHSFSFYLEPTQAIYLLLIPILYIVYYYAIEKGQISFVGTIFATYPIVTILLSTTLLKEQLSLFQVLMIFLILSGGVILALSERLPKLRDFKSSWIAWGILGAVTTGVADFLVKDLLVNVSIHTYNFYYPFFYLTGFLVYFLLDRTGRKMPKNSNLKSYSYTTIGILLMNVGILFLNFAFSEGPASLVSTVSSSYAGVTIFLSFFLLKEKIKRIQWMALSLILVGILFINF
jgi:uncharacterized membrane protein